jgi:putative tricarboxylic transport membrane protein
MALGNLLNWTIGGVFMRSMGIMARIPIRILLPIVLLITLTAIYVQDTRLAALWIAFGFGILGYVFRKLDIPVLPFVIAFILAGNLERTARQAFSASGGDPYFLLGSWVSIAFLALAVASVIILGRGDSETRTKLGKENAR